MRLELRDFGVHDSLTIATEARVVIAVGPNRVGKTTLRDAVEFALLGTCALRGFSLKKDVARHMIHGAADRAVVTLRVDGWAVRRTVRATGAQKVEVDAKGNGGFVEFSAAQWSEFFPAEQNPLAVRAALESEALWRATPEDRAALLVALAAGVGTTPGLVLDALDARVERSPEVEALVEQAAGDGFEAARAVVVERRREAKRELKALGDLSLAPLPPEAARGCDPMGSEVDEQRRAVAAARAELAAAERAAAVDVGRLQGLRDAAAAALKATDAEWADNSLAVWREFPVEPWADDEKVGPTEVVAAGDFVEQAALVGERVRGLNGDQTTREARLREIEAETREVPLETAAPPDPPAQCPASACPMPCPVPPAAFANAYRAAAAEAEAARAAGAARRKALLEEARALHEEVESISLRRNELVAEAEALLARARRREELDRNGLRLKAAVDLATARLEQADRALAAAASAPSPEVVDSFRALVEGRAAALAAREAYDAEFERFTARQRAAERLHARVEALDVLDAELSPDGVEARLAGKSASTVREALAEVEDVCGRVELTPEFEVTIGGRHIASASKSEQRVAGLALQRAVAAAVDLPVVVVDELDALDSAWRARFREFAALWCAEDSRTLLALATSEASPPAAPPAGLATAWLTGDGVQMIESRG